MCVCWRERRFETERGRESVHARERKRGRNMSERKRGRNMSERMRGRNLTRKREEET